MSQRNVSPRISRRQLIQSSATATLAGVLAPARADAKSNSSARSVIGMNLAPICYWMSERPFNNLFLTSGAPVAQRQGGKWADGGTLDRDEHGWVQRYESGQYSTFVLDLKRGHPSGIYRVGYNGQRTAIRVLGGDGNQFVKGSPNARLIVNCYAPIRDVVVKESSNSDRNTFYAPFLDRCRQFRVLRFMDWQNTNVDREPKWDSRTTDESSSQSEQEVALEHMIGLCNTTSCGMWYCLHHRADDHYATQVARMIRSQLNQGLPVYLEHSNEVWNGMFPQHKFARGKTASFLDYHVQRTAEIARIFRREGVEVVSVLGLQSVNTWAATQALKRGVPEDINATAIAPYFGGAVGQGDDYQRVRSGGTPYILDSCRKDLTAKRSEIRTHRELADQYGLQLLAYEAGQHLVAPFPHRRDQAYVDLLIRANRDPQMYDLYRDFLDIWDEETDHSLICLFHSVSDPGQSGCWGLLEYEGQPIQQAPKYRAVVERTAAPQA